MQMVLAAMLIDALHAALEDRKVAFNGVGMDDPTHVFADAVVDGLMHPIFAPERAVSLRRRPERLADIAPYRGRHHPADQIDMDQGGEAEDEDEKAEDEYAAANPASSCRGWCR